MGLLVYYGTINRPFYVVLTAIVMAASVMISYTRTRAEHIVPTCKVGFLERPERIVLLIIGALFDRMAPVLWVIAVLGTITVIHRMYFTWQETRRIEGAQLREEASAAFPNRSRSARASRGPEWRWKPAGFYWPSSRTTVASAMPAYASSKVTLY